MTTLSHLAPSPRRAAVARPLSDRAVGSRVARPDPKGASRLPLTVTLLVLAASLAGAVLAGLQLARGAGALPGEVPVSFGAAVVGTATTAKSVPASAMQGMTHEASSAADGRRVVLPVTLVNRTDVPVAYRPEQFRLLVAGADPAVPGDSPLLAGDLRPGGAVTLRLAFTVSVDAAAARLALDPADPARTVDVALPGAAAPADPAAPADAAVADVGPHTGH